jgi:hypothetical protein
MSGDAAGHGHGDVPEGAALGFGERADPPGDAFQPLPVCRIKLRERKIQRRALDHERLTRSEFAELLRMLAQGRLPAPAYVVDDRPRRGESLR